MFDFSNAKESDFQPIPKGTYNVELTMAEDTTSKSGNKMFKLTFEILDKSHAGRKLFGQFVYGGPSASQKVIEISAAKIKEMCKCMGIEPKFKDISDLVGKHCAVVTKIRSDEQYGDRAEISYFKPVQAPKFDASEPAPF